MNPALRILHLEDDDADARLIKDALREEGMTVRIVVVKDRAGFMAALKRTSYDIVLSDYRLPAFDGLQALMLWRARWPTKPFLFVTGSMGEDLAVESLRCGATDYILKGNLVRLAPAIHRAMAEVREHTRRERTEAALRASEARFRNMADHSPFMIWLTGEDKKCIWVNQRWLDFVGQSLEQEVGGGFVEHLHPEDAQRVFNIYVAAFDARQPFRAEYRLRRHDGEWRWVLDNGVPHYDAGGQFTGYIGSCVEITEQKEAEHEVRKLNAELRRRVEEMNLLLNMLPVGVWVGNSDCTEIRGNPAAYRIFNIPEDINVSFTAAKPQMPPGIRFRVDGVEVPAEELPMQKVARTGEACNNCELDFLFPDGTVKAVYGSVAPLFDEQGIVRRVIGAYGDFTERKRAEEALKTSLREKEVLLREVHHRVKNNLQVISSLISLQTDRSRDRALQSLFQDVRDRVRTMALVHEKLYESDSLARVNFAEYARSLLDYLWRAHGREANRIQLKLDLQPVTLSMDVAVPCGLLLNEVTTNALKHAFRRRARGEVVVALQNDSNGHVHLGVHDDGVGLPRNLDWRQSGSLGLRLVRMLVGQLNGTLEVSSNGGTGFSIHFDPERATHGAEPDPPPPKSAE